MPGRAPHPRSAGNEQEKQIRIRAGERPVSGLAGRRFLVVDDTPSAREILRRMLEREGAVVDVAGGGEEALERVLAGPGRYDAVLVDMQMPDKDGPEVIVEMRERCGLRAPVLAASASFSARDIERCDAAGVSARMLKPFRAANVLAALQGLLAGAAARAQECAPLAGAVAPGEAMEGPVEQERPEFDLGTGLERCCGDVALFNQLLRLYCERYGGWATDVRSWTESGEKFALQRALHALKGESADLGLNEVHRLTELAERSLQAGSDQDRALGRLGIAVARGVSELQRNRAEFSRAVQDRRGQREGGHPPSRQAQPAASDPPGRADSPLETLCHWLRLGDLRALEAIDESSDLLWSRFERDQAVAIADLISGLQFKAALRLLGSEETSAARAEPAEPGPRAARILIVDDTPASVRLLARAIAGLGEVRFALDGDSALQIFRDWPADVVLLDQEMPGMSGVELCRKLKSSVATENAAVIFVTHSSDLALEVEAMAAGASDLLAKPISPVRVRARVSGHIRQRTQRESLDALQAREFEEAPVSLFMAGEKGELLNVNAHFARLLGQPAEALVQRNILDLVDPAEVEAMRERIAAFAAAGRRAATSSIEVGLMHIDGGRVPARCFFRHIQHGELNVLYVNVEDLSVQKRLESQAFEAAKLDALGRLTGGLAHDYNNALAIVIGNLDLALSAMRAEDPVRGRVETALRAAERISEVSRSLLSVVRRRDSGGTGVDINRLIDEMRPLIGQMLGECRLVLQLDAGIGQTVLDQGRFEAVVLGLVTNAREAMPDGGELTIRTQRVTAGSAAGQAAVGLRSGDYVQLELRDTGRGMTQSVLARAFEPLFTTKPRERATGLGLSKARAFAESVNGAVSLDSAPGVGTGVYLWLPCEAVEDRAFTPP